MQIRAFGTLLVDVKDAVCTITLNRPDRRNAINPQMANELLWALEDAAQSDDVRALVITGAGGHFCAGGDLGGMAGGEDALPSKGDFSTLLLNLARYEKPTVACVRGNAMGGAMGLLASIDFVVAETNASFGTPEIKRGLFPFMILAPLARVVPRRTLTQWMLLGEKLSAAEVKQGGLITDICDDAELDARVQAVATKLAAQSPTAMRLGLRAYRNLAEEDLETSLPKLRDALAAILATEDAREGLTAFMEKRAPVWTGR